MGLRASSRPRGSRSDVTRARSTEGDARMIVTDRGPSDSIYERRGDRTDLLNVAERAFVQTLEFGINTVCALKRFVYCAEGHMMHRGRSSLKNRLLNDNVVAQAGGAGQTVLM